jgi:hypothetical protein
LGIVGGRTGRIDQARDNIVGASISHGRRYAIHAGVGYAPIVRARAKRYAIRQPDAEVIAGYILANGVGVSGDTLSRYQARRAGDEVVASKHRILAQALEMDASRVRYEEEEVVVDLNMGEGRSCVEKDVVSTIVELGVTN